MREASLKTEDAAVMKVVIVGTILGRMDKNPP